MNYTLGGIHPMEKHTWNMLSCCFDDTFFFLSFFLLVLLMMIIICQWNPPLGKLCYGYVETKRRREEEKKRRREEEKKKRKEKREKRKEKREKRKEKRDSQRMETKQTEQAAAAAADKAKQPSKTITHTFCISTSHT